MNYDFKFQKPTMKLGKVFLYKEVHHFPNELRRVMVRAEDPQPLGEG